MSEAAGTARGFEALEELEDEMAVVKANPDHDLLVRLDTKLDVLAISFNETRLAVGSKAEAARLEKLEVAVDGIKAKIYWAAGALTAAQFAIHFLLK